MALLAAGTLLALQAQSLWWLGVGMVMLFAGINTLEAVLPALVTRLAPSNLRGTASGIFSTSQFLGIFVGGVAGGYVLGQGGITAIAYSVVALALLWSLSVINLRLIAST
jgi:predicted MFS family arabinose efflux permease